MIKKLLATTAVLAMVAAASANISAFITAPTTVTLTAGAAYYQDIYVTVDAGDSWTAAGLDATVSSSFYQDAFDANPPNPALFGVFPDSEFTSYYTSPGDYPNAAYNGAIVGIAASNDAGNVLDTDWFDTISPETGGDYMIARITVLGDPAVDTGTGHLQYASVGNTTLQDFDFMIGVPEPASLALLVLGGLVVARRR